MDIRKGSGHPIRPHQEPLEAQTVLHIEKGKLESGEIQSV